MTLQLLRAQSRLHFPPLAPSQIFGGCVVSVSPADLPSIPVSWLPPPSSPRTSSMPARVASASPILPRPRPSLDQLITGCVQHFAVTPTAAGWARRHAFEVLNQWHAAAVSDDAVLVVSELVGNAVRHAAATGWPPGSCCLVLKLFADALAIEVWDPSPGTVAPSIDDDLLSESGRGLAIVEALCGAPPMVFAGPGDGKTVVAILPRHSHGASACLPSTP